MISEEPKVSIEPPKELTKQTVIYWSAEYKRLMGIEGTSALRTKARKFIEQECIDYDRVNKHFICKPIKTYNKTTYKIEKYAGEFKCNCQFNVTTQSMCSHILAVHLWLKIYNWNRRQITDNEYDYMEVNDE